MSSAAYNALMTHLSQEREAIRKAGFARLDEMAGKKEDLFLQVAQATLSNAELSRLKQAIDRNQSLLAAAIAGVHAAQTRLAALDHVRAGLSVYDQSGQMATYPTTKPDIEKKA